MKKIKKYLFYMLMFQVVIIIVAIIPINVNSVEKLHFIVLTDCGLFGATVFALYTVCKTITKNEQDK